MKYIKKQVLIKTNFLVIVVIVLSISFLQLFGIATAIATRFSGENKQPVRVSSILASKACSEDSTSKSYVPTHITISSVNIDLPVVPVTLVQGTWEVHDGVANYAVETSIVSNKKGNVGIFAHDRDNAFTRIKNLHTGDRIEVLTAAGKATYTVTSSHVTEPTDVEVFDPTVNPTLTLVTCSGIFSEQRYIVKAKLVSFEKGNCHAENI